MNMSNQIFHDLAAKGAAIPIGADLVLREDAQAEAILLDGERMSAVLEQAADRFGSPLALPIMDLTTEKDDLLQNWFGVSPEACGTWHLDSVPSETVLSEVAQNQRPLSPRLRANVEAIRSVSARGRKVPCGMSIGPFSLMTKLVASPIEPVFMAGMGMTGEDDDEVLLVERTLELAIAEIRRSLLAQIQAGAKVVFIAEPAPNIAYFSPNQIASGSDVFHRLAISYDRQVTDLLHEHGVLCIFHCCGELIDPMVSAFCSLNPAMLSLGSSRDLARDAALVPRETVLYGNLPSKRFYSDELCPPEEVIEMAEELVSKMREVGHPFILGTECDVLSVPGAEETIKAKVMSIVRRGGNAG
jgi:uroporphyrinogen-III decarboxylase